MKKNKGKFLLFWYVFVCLILVIRLYGEIYIFNICLFNVKGSVKENVIFLLNSLWDWL